MARGADELVAVGRLNGAWSVQGWVRVFSYTDPPEAIFDYQPWLTGEEHAELFVSEWRQAGLRLVARIEGIESPEAADRFRRREIRVRRELLPQPDPGRYYWHDLSGCVVENLEGLSLGTVSGLIPTGAHDVLEITGDNGEKLLVPFVPGHYVIQVDTEARRIRVDWQPDWK